MFEGAERLARKGFSSTSREVVRQAASNLDPALVRNPQAPIDVNDVFANIPRPATIQVTDSCGVNDALPPIPELNDPNKLLSSIAYSMDRLANPDISTKPGALESMKRNEDLLVFASMFRNSYHVARCPGVTFKQLAMGLKSLNDRLRPLYNSLDIPCGFANRFCLGASALTWGCRPGDPDHVIGEQDFVSWAQANSTLTAPRVIGLLSP